MLPVTPKGSSHLHSLVQTLRKVGPPKWTSEQTMKLSHSVQKAVQKLKSHAKKLDLKINGDTELFTARKEVYDMMKEQAK